MFTAITAFVEATTAMVNTAETYGSEFSVKVRR
jgi:hypothetical protein